MTTRPAQRLATLAALAWLCSTGCGGGGPFQGDPAFTVLGTETTADGRLSTYRVKVSWEGAKSTPNYAVYLVEEPARFDPARRHARRWVWRARAIEPLLTVWQSPETLLVQVADDSLAEENSYTVRKQSLAGVFVITDRVAAPEPASEPAAAEEEVAPPRSLFDEPPAPDSAATGNGAAEPPR